MTPARTTVGWAGDVPIVLLDSISYIAAEDAETVVVSGSHGGSAAGRYALEHPPRLAVFNDAGIGKDRAGVAALDMLEAQAIPAVAVAHTSARVGEAADTWASGVISTVNHQAEALGLRPGDRLAEVIGRLDL